MERSPIVVPIRFAAGELAVQTTTRELSRAGVLVRCLTPPPIGAELELKLFLPGARQAMEARGIVREHSRAGEDPGFWAEFASLDEAQKTQLGELLGRRRRAGGATPIGAVAVLPQEDPRRAFPRYKARFAVRFATVQDFVLEYAANISAGGVFVHTEQPPPLKTVVQVEMELPGGGGPVPARGIVVHRVTRQDADQKGTLPGVGVQFMDADDAFRQRIDAAIEHILASDRAA